MLRHLILALILLLPLTAAAAPGRVQQLSASGDRIDIAGLWHSTCAPVVRQWQRDAAGAAHVLLAGAGESCAPAIRRFRVRVDTGTSFSPALTTDSAAPLQVHAVNADETISLVGFGLSGQELPVVRPDSGFWWPTGDEAASGTVLSIERQGDTLGIALLSYDDRSGAATWHFGTTDLEGPTARAELVRLADGSSPFLGLPITPVPEPSYVIHLAFDSSTRARAWLTRPDALDAGALELVSLGFTRRSFDEAAPHTREPGPWLLARAAGAADDEAWPRALELLPAAGDPAPAWGDAATGAVLTCAGGTDRGLADHCTLRDSAGRLMAEFPVITADRMDGTDLRGEPVILLRPR